MVNVHSLVSFLLSAASAVTVSALPQNLTRDDVSFLLNGRADTGINAKSPFDHSWITNIAAIGDSYSTGLGAGHRVSAHQSLKLNPDCTQFSYGYPNLLSSNGLLGYNPSRVLEYMACSGAKINDVITSQLNKISKSDVILLSIGGNDLDFVNLINYCIYQWSTWEPFYTCQGELDKTKNFVNSAYFTAQLNLLIKLVEQKLKNPTTTSRIYWTGYERFWNPDTPECDDVTWAFTRKYGFRQYLTRDHRKQMNDLVDTLNGKIKAACSTVQHCVYVDSNTQIDALKGRYCAPGVDEHYHWPGGGVSANREVTGFYEWGTTKDDDESGDSGRDQPQKRDPASVLIAANNNTYEGRIASLIKQGLQFNQMDPNITQYALPGITANSDLVPDYYAKVFHRTKFGNGIVAANVLKAMDVEQGKMMNQPATPTTVSLCPIAAAQTAAPTGSACQGNQIQGSCTQAHFPTLTPNSGPQAPNCNKVGTNNLVRISDTKAKSAVTDYCDNLIKGKTVLDSKNTSPNAGTVAGAAEDGGTLTLTVLFDVAMCDKGTKPEDQKVDFGVMTAKQCYDNFYTTLAQVCAEDPSWKDYDKDYPLEGGVWGSKCAQWSMAGIKK